MRLLQCQRGGTAGSSGIPKTLQCTEHWWEQLSIAGKDPAALELSLTSPWPAQLQKPCQSSPAVHGSVHRAVLTAGPEHSSSALCMPAAPAGGRGKPQLGVQAAEGCPPAQCAHQAEPSFPDTLQVCSAPTASDPCSTKRPRMGLGLHTQRATAEQA